MKLYTSDEVTIRHDELVRLRRENKVSLGIGVTTAEKISLSRDVSPTKTTAASAYKFWQCAAALGLLYSVYLSFTAHWWWFIVGIVCALIVSKAAMRANQTNLIDAAMIDPEFYERVARLGGWCFHMAEADAEPFFTDDFREGGVALAKFRAALQR